MRQLIFILRLIDIAAQIVGHFVVANGDLAVNFTLTQTRHQHLQADFLAQLAPVQPFAFHSTAKIGQIIAVLFGDAGQCRFKLGIVDTQTNLTGVLAQHRFGDHLVERLFFEFTSGWRGHALSGQVLPNRFCLVIEVDLRNHIAVDHRHHTINGSDRRSSRQGAGDQDHSK